MTKQERIEAIERIIEDNADFFFKREKDKIYISSKGLAKAIEKAIQIDQGKIITIESEWKQDILHNDWKQTLPQAISSNKEIIKIEEN